MKIAINFYQESLKPSVEYLTLKNVSIVSVIVLLVMLSWAGTLYIKNINTLANTKKVTGELAIVEQTLANFQQALVKHNDSATYSSQKTKLERELQVKSYLLNQIMLKDSESGVNYYQVMKDLTEHHDHNIWLTDFVFNENDVFFNGFAMQSNAVTRWLSFLQSTQSFQGREFSQLSIVAQDEEVLSFQAATSAALVKQQEVTE